MANVSNNLRRQYLAENQKSFSVARMNNSAPLRCERLWLPLPHAAPQTGRSGKFLHASGTQPLEKSDF
jgi:hypothetical protein